MLLTHTEIREMLGKVTRPPWYKLSGDDADKKYYVFTPRGVVAASVLRDDAAFIAAAPSIINQLLEERTILRKRIELMKKPGGVGNHGNCCVCQECRHAYDDCVCEHNRILDTVLTKIGE